jgi:hypothetical protein
MPSTRAARTTRSNDPLSGHGTPGALRVSVGVSSGRRVTVCSVTFPASAASLGCAGLDFFPRSQEGDPLFCVERGSSFVEGGSSRLVVTTGEGPGERGGVRTGLASPARRSSRVRPVRTMRHRAGRVHARREGIGRIDALLGGVPGRSEGRGGAIRHATRPSWSLRRVSARAPSGPIRRMGRCAARSCKRRSRAACRPSTPPKTNGTCNPRDP